MESDAQLTNHEIDPLEEYSALLFDQLIEVSLLLSHTKSGTMTWARNSQDQTEYLSSIDGEVWEVGGPTEKFSLIDQSRIKNTMRIVNIPPRTGLNAYAKVPREVSVLADGTALPIGNAILAGLLVSNFSGERKPLIDEVSRVIKSDGLFVWQGGKPEDLAMIISKGFTLQSFELQISDASENPHSIGTDQQLVWSGVFKKTTEASSTSDVVSDFVNIIKNAKKQEFSFEIPNYHPVTGKPLETDAARVNAIQYLYWSKGVWIPNTHEDGTALSPEEQMNYVREKYSSS